MAMSNELFQQFLQTTDMVERTKSVANSISAWNHNKTGVVVHLDDVSIGEQLRSELQVVTNLFSSLVSYGKLTLMLTDVYRIVDENLATALADADIKMVTGSYIRKNNLVTDFLVPIQDEWQFIIIGGKWFFGVDNRFNNYYTIKKKQAINKARDEARQGVAQ